MTYVRNAWYVAGWADDLAANQVMAITILNEPIAIYRGESGKVAALEDRCVHRLAPLSLGRCEGERLRCMYHGLLFDAEGRAVEIPGQEQIPPQARVRSYPIVERHSWLWVWMGEGAADDSLVPPAVGLDDPHYLLFKDQLDYDAEAQLICDNLLDFSHLTYVHAKSFGAGDTWARDRPRITPLERGVRVERWTQAQPGIPGQQDWQTPRDRFIGYDFLVPGILLMATAAYPVGTAQACDFGTPDLAEAESNANFTSQAVTPGAPGKARYFFSAGPRVGHGDEAARDRFHVVTLMAFEEDRVMIEAQHKVTRATPGYRPMPTTADKAITLYNAAAARLARAASRTIVSAGVSAGA